MRAEQAFNPASEIVRPVLLMCLQLSPDKSVGVAHEIAPSQYTGTSDFGVAPLTISAISPSVVCFQFIQACPQARQDQH